MIFEFKNFFSSVKFFLVLLVFFAIISGLAWLYFDNIKKQQAQFYQNIQNLSQNYLNGNVPATSDFIAKLESLDKTKLRRTAQDETVLQLYLGESYLISKKTDDGIEILKKIAENEASDTDIRAQSMLFLSRYHDFYPDDNTAKQKIFIGEFFFQFIKNNPDNVAEAFRNLDEFANKMSPNPDPCFRIARWYSGELLSGSALSSEKKNEYFSQARNYLQEGDEFLKVSRLSLSQSAYTFQLKARALENLYFARKDETNINDVEMYYKQPLIAGADQKNSAFFGAIAAYTRFYYAAFLARVDKTGRQNDIKDILDPLYNVSIRNYLIFSFLKMAQKDSRNPYYNDIANLSVIDPRFESLMEQL